MQQLAGQISPLEPLYTADDLAKRWRISRDAVYRVPETLLPYLRVGPKGGARRYRREDIESYERRMITK